MKRKQIKNLLRLLPLYYYWLKHKEKKQLEKFNLNLDDFKKHKVTINKIYSIDLIVERLKKKKENRRILSFSQNKPTIIAFGDDSNWESYGLWPTFKRISNFNLFPQEVV